MFGWPVVVLLLLTPTALRPELFACSFHTFGLNNIGATTFNSQGVVEDHRGVAEKYHEYLEREFVRPFVGKCSRGVRIGYFDVAIDVEIVSPGNMTSWTPTNDSTIPLEYKVAQQNFWVIPYLNLCSTTQLHLVMDEDITSFEFLCGIISDKSSVRTLRGVAELSQGLHTLQVLPVLNAVNDSSFVGALPDALWMGAMRKSWLWFGRHEYASPNHKGATDHYNANPGELFDLAIVQSDLGWYAASKNTLTVANTIFSERSAYYRDIDHYPFLHAHWTYEEEPLLDPSFYSESPVLTSLEGCSVDRFMYFRYTPTGGLNNQINEIVQMVAIAHVLKRTLVLPELSLEAPSLYSGYDGGKCNVTDGIDMCLRHSMNFQQLFDVRKVKRKLGGMVCIQTREEYLLMQDELWRSCKVCSAYVPHSREAPLDWYRREFKDRHSAVPTLIVMRPNGLSHYPVKFFGPHALSIENRIRKALVFHDNLEKAAMHVVDQLFALSGTQNSFMAVHQRVEDDWLEHSVHMDRLFGFRGEFWVSSADIQARVDALSHLKGMKVVYLSVAENNIDRTFRKEEFRNFFRTWEINGAHHVARIFSNFSDPYGVREMPYLLQSAVDFLICKSSAVFVGNGYSTFSQMVSRQHSFDGKPSFVYNGMKHSSESQKAVKLRTDKGRLLEPFYAVEISAYLSDEERTSSLWYELHNNQSLQMQRNSMENFMIRWEPFDAGSLSSFSFDRQHFGVDLDPWPFFLEPVRMTDTSHNEHTFYVYLPGDHEAAARSFCRKTVAGGLQAFCVQGLRAEILKILEEAEKKKDELYALRFGPTQEKIDSRLTLKEIGLEERNDKIHYHHYDDIYTPLFEPLRKNTNLTILEIGNSHSSLSMWQRYFPHAKIYGIDLGLWNGCGLPEYKKLKKKRFGCIYSDRVWLFQGDVLNESFMAEVLKAIGGPGSLDLIIDDGAHTPEHSIATFINLFQVALKPGGLYSIEDIETNYWSRGGNLYGNHIKTGRGAKESMVEMFKSAIDTINRHFFDMDFSAFHKDTEHAIESLHFSHNVIVAKRRETDNPRNKEIYRYANFVENYRVTEAVLAAALKQGAGDQIVFPANGSPAHHLTDHQDGT